MVAKKHKWTRRKKILIIFGIVFVAFYSKTPVTRFVKSSIFEYKISSFKKEYLQQHPQPCDNILMAYDAAKKYLLKHIPHSPIIIDGRLVYRPFLDLSKIMYSSMYLKKYKPTQAKKITRSEIFRYSQSGKCTFRFVGVMQQERMHGFDGDAIRYQVEVQYINGEWQKTFFRKPDLSKRINLEKWYNWSDENDG